MVREDPYYPMSISLVKLISRSVFGSAVCLGAVTQVEVRHIDDIK